MAKLSHLGSSAAAHKMAAPGLALTPIPTGWATATRDQSGHLGLTGWSVQDGAPSEFDLGLHLVSSGAIDDVTSSRTYSFERIIVEVLANGKGKLRLWHFEGQAGVPMESTPTAGGGMSLDSWGEHFATAYRNGDGNLAIDVWTHGDASALAFLSHHESTSTTHGGAGISSPTRVLWLGNWSLVTIFIAHNSHLRIMLWKVSDDAKNLAYVTSADDPDQTVNAFDAAKVGPAGRLVTTSTDAAGNFRIVTWLVTDSAIRKWDSSVLTVAATSFAVAGCGAQTAIASQFATATTGTDGVLHVSFFDDGALGSPVAAHGPPGAPIEQVDILKRFNGLLTATLRSDGTLQVSNFGLTLT